MAVFLGLGDHANCSPVCILEELPLFGLLVPTFLHGLGATGVERDVAIGVVLLLLGMGVRVGLRVVQVEQTRVACHRYFWRLLLSQLVHQVVIGVRNWGLSRLDIRLRRQVLRLLLLEWLLLDVHDLARDRVLLSGALVGEPVSLCRLGLPLLEARVNLRQVVAQLGARLDLHVLVDLVLGQVLLLNQQSGSLRRTQAPLVLALLAVFWSRR